MLDETSPYYYFVGYGKYLQNILLNAMQKTSKFKNIFTTLYNRFKKVHLKTFEIFFKHVFMVFFVYD